MAEAPYPVSILSLETQRLYDVLTFAQRQRIANLVEALLAILDADDGDLDLEPSLGWSKTGASTRFDADPTTWDLEADYASWCCPQAEEAA